MVNKTEISFEKKSIFQIFLDAFGFLNFNLLIKVKWFFRKWLNFLLFISLVKSNERGEYSNIELADFFFRKKS